MKTVKVGISKRTDIGDMFWASISGKRITGLKEATLHITKEGKAEFNLVTDKEKIDIEVIGFDLNLYGSKEQ